MGGVFNSIEIHRLSSEVIMYIRAYIWEVIGIGFLRLIKGSGVSGSNVQ